MTSHGHDFSTKCLISWQNDCCRRITSRWRGVSSRHLASCRLLRHNTVACHRIMLIHRLLSHLLCIQKNILKHTNILCLAGCVHVANVIATWLQRQSGCVHVAREKSCMTTMPIYHLPAYVRVVRSTKKLTTSLATMYNSLKSLSTCVCVKLYNLWIRINK